MALHNDPEVVISDHTLSTSYDSDGASGVIQNRQADEWAVLFEYAQGTETSLLFKLEHALDGKLYALDDDNGGAFTLPPDQSIAEPGNHSVIVRRAVGGLKVSVKAQGTPSGASKVTVSVQPIRFDRT